MRTRTSSRSSVLSPHINMITNTMRWKKYNDCARKEATKSSTLWLQAGEEELNKTRVGNEHGCNIQIRIRKFKRRSDKNHGQTKKTTEASQQPTPLYYDATINSPLRCRYSCNQSTIEKCRHSRFRSWTLWRNERHLLIPGWLPH